MGTSVNVFECEKLESRRVSPGSSKNSLPKLYSYFYYSETYRFGVRDSSLCRLALSWWNELTTGWLNATKLNSAQGGYKVLDCHPEPDQWRDKVVHYTAAPSFIIFHI